MSVSDRCLRDTCPCHIVQLLKFNLLWISRNNQQDAACNRIYYSKVYWRFNMFRAAHRSSSRALNCICSLCFTYPCGDRPLSSLLYDNGRSPHVCVNQRLQIQFRALMMSGMPLETCWSFNKLWNNKFYYKLHLVGYFYWFILRCTDPWILKINFLC
jgi:hypothetical protein